LQNRRPQHPTAREEEILRAIRHSIQDRGEALSVRQPAPERGLRSLASVACHLANLEELGALVRDGRSYRSRLRDEILRKMRGRSQEQ
jgi:SOS-response transcriptional repressor LexA